MSHLLTRFAPAPTGSLHLGHVVNAVFVWGIGGALGAPVVLRIEDHDRQRSHVDFERGILDDLDWLEFTPDVYPTGAFRRGRCDSRQSERDDLYAATARSLIDSGLVYGCECSRRDIAEQQAAQGLATGRYPGTCRELGLAPGPDMTWRIRVDAATEHFTDLLLGPQTQNPAAHGDIAIRDRHGNWTYHFAVVVDDQEQRINLVIRGKDLLEATAVQMGLARVIGRTVPPRFAHHPLVMKTAQFKLSKADGDSGIHELRRAGWSPARVIGHAAAVAGLAPPGTSIEAREVAALFAYLASASGRNALPLQK